MGAMRIEKEETLWAESALPQLSRFLRAGSSGVLIGVFSELGVYETEKIFNERKERSARCK